MYLSYMLDISTFNIHFININKRKNKFQGQNLCTNVEIGVFALISSSLVSIGDCK